MYSVIVDAAGQHLTSYSLGKKNVLLSNTECCVYILGDQADI